MMNMWATLNPLDSILLKLGALGCFLFYAIWKYCRSTGKDQPVEGAVYVTGCDSGMGETTAFHLAKVGYHVYAACYLAESFEKYKVRKEKEESQPSPSEARRKQLLLQLHLHLQH